MFKYTNGYLILLTMLLTSCGGGGSEAAPTKPITPANSAPSLTVETNVNLIPRVANDLDISFSDPDGDSVEISVNAPDLTIQWQISNNQNTLQIAPDVTSNEDAVTSHTINITATDSKGSKTTKTINVTVQNDIEISNYRVYQGISGTDGCVEIHKNLACWGSHKGYLDDILNTEIENGTFDNWAANHTNLGVKIDNKVIVANFFGIDSNYNDIPLSNTYVGLIDPGASGDLLVAHENGLIKEPGNYAKVQSLVSAPIVPGSFPLISQGSYIKLEDGTWSCIPTITTYEECAQLPDEAISIVAILPDVFETYVFYLTSNGINVTYTDPNKDLSQIRSVLSGLTNPTEMVSSDKQKSLFVLNNNQIVKLKFVGDEFAIVDNPLSSRVDLKSIYVDYNSLYYGDYICALNKVNRLVCSDSDGPLAIPDPFSE